MGTIVLRPADPERDFGQLAAWFSLLEDEPTTEAGLKEYYGKTLNRIIQIAAKDEQGELLGFYWATRDRMVSDRLNFFLFVKPEQRGQGIGRQLYEDLAQAVIEAQAKKLRVSVWDNYPEWRAFAERRGFSERSHQIAMALDLEAFDDRPYDEIFAKLKGEGFQFTSMEALGNTEEAQRKLYILNDTTDIETPGADGEHSWDSFEDFQERVCRADWYKPGGQMVVLDTTSHGVTGAAIGPFVAMSAITRLEGNDYAYNLHTGVDRPYRGRKLAQAVKVLALRYARDVLKATTVHTHHNSKNLPMIAIDRKFGYIQTPGTFSMEKILG
jgi:GNAT superfamily N-acetyltransferase